MTLRVYFEDMILIGCYIRGTHRGQKYQYKEMSRKCEDWTLGKNDILIEQQIKRTKHQYRTMVGQYIGRTRHTEHMSLRGEDRLSDGQYIERR